VHLGKEGSRFVYQRLQIALALSLSDLNSNFKADGEMKIACDFMYAVNK